MTFARKNHLGLNQASFYQKFVGWIFFIVCFPTLAAAQVATVDDFTLAEGFEAELVYSVPDGQGSWVSLTTDPKGRLIACDQYGAIYRITMTDGKASVSPLELNLGAAQGLLCAFDSLYVMSSGMKNGKFKSEPGLYRLQDTNGDDQYDKVEYLQKIFGRGEHGAHAIVLSPDKKSLFICAGNMTGLPPLSGSRQPQVWQEDQVIKRFLDPRGHANTLKAPGGWICKTDPEGKSFELFANGFRNEYDIAFDPNGELFTFDSDMEWDIGLPWYRSTRVCHVVSGAEFGWRTGSGKWPEYYADSVAPILNVGPGSPTGVTFGTGAKFPAKYQNAFFISDWSYGAIYTVHLTPNGASFTATKERFCSAPALPVTDIVVNPTDGNIYFAIGGRRSDSALYRIKYVGAESTSPATYPAPTELALERHKLEAGHKPDAKIDMQATLKALSSTDRSIRYAARIAIENRPSSIWTKDISSQPTQAKLEMAMALARVNPKAQAIVVGVLSGIDFSSLSWDQKMHLIRDYGLVLTRTGDPTDATKQTIQKLEANFPTGDQLIDQELARLLVASQSPTIVAKLVEIFKEQDTQEAQVATALTLSEAKVGWTLDLYRDYFQTMLDNANSRGGNSFDGYVVNIRQHAISKLSEKYAQELSGLLARRPEKVDPYAELKARPVVKSWTVAELLPTGETKLAGRDLANGKKMFAVATCYKCHRIHREGGVVGPDLTTAGRR
ncbi:L-sorbosone dehydrogenase, partial [Mariniblastus sp.]|nr:L-sorbosone dehydrogenase [Mariniblastus sp.]